MRRMDRLPWILLVTALACEKSAEPAPAGRGAPPGGPTQEGGVSPESTQAPAGTQKHVTWSEPEGWTKEQTPRPLRVATYKVPKAANEPEDAELAVFHFGPGDGGGIEANITRWVGQFSDVPTADIVRDERRTASGLAIHVVEILRGTYASGMPGRPTTPKADFGLLGAIVEAPGGNYFFKLTGPTGTLQRERDKFFKMLDSARTASAPK